MRCVVFTAIVFGLSGCMMEVVTTTAIQGELAAESAKSATSTLEHVEDTQKVLELQSAVRTYNGLHGAYPATLDELVPSVLTKVPKQKDGRPFKYNSATGIVSLSRGADVPARPQAVPAVTQEDLRNLEQIGAAIYRYWETTGLYPPNLESLAPDYMTSVPTMANGQAYVYNVQTGAVNHPRELMAPRANPNAQPLPDGNNPNAIASGNTNRQLQVMDDLGL